MKKIIGVLVVLIHLNVFAAEPTAQSEMGLANEALEKKDYAAYLQHMKRAVDLGPDRVGRPYFQYALARAYAYNNKLEDAVNVLQQVWDEKVEGPMIFLAAEDPAFASYRGNPQLKRILELQNSPPLNFVPVSGTVVQIEGAGCNLAVLAGTDSIVMVDTGYPQVAKALNEALRKRYPDKTVQFIMNTHEHMDHVGGNAVLGSEHATIIAHESVPPALEKPSELFSDFSLPGPPKDQWPNITFDQWMTLYIDNEVIQILGLPAHSEGDSIVYFSKSKVLHMGDNYFPDTSPMLFPGPQLQQYFSRFGPFLASLPSDVTVMSGHASPVPVAALREHYSKSEKLFQLVARNVKEKKSLDETIAAAEKEQYPARWAKYFFEKLQAASR